MLIGEDTVVFEPDEEGSYRALSQQVAVSPALLGIIAEKLQSLNA